MKKTFVLLSLLVSTVSFGNSEDFYVDFSMKEPVIRAGLAEAKKNVATNFIYNENDMYRIYTRAGFITSILLQPGEEVVYLAGGDTARWTVDQGITGTKEGNRTVIAIKPFEAGLKTNLVVNTNKRSYNFFLHSANDWYNPVVTFLYPQEIKMAQIKKEATQENITVVDASNLNFKYEYNNKNYKWAPAQVFDDGQKTYLVMKPEMKTDEAPALFVQDSSRELNLVNYRLKGNYYIVDRLFDRAVLKLGKNEIIIKRNGTFVRKDSDNYNVAVTRGN